MGSRSGKRLTPKEKVKHRERLRVRRSIAPIRRQQPVPPGYREVHAVLRSHVRGVLARQKFEPDLLQVQGLEYHDGHVVVSVRVAKERSWRTPTTTTVFRMDLADPTLLDKLEEFLAERAEEARNAVPQPKYACPDV